MGDDYDDLHLHKHQYTMTEKLPRRTFLTTTAQAVLAAGLAATQRSAGAAQAEAASASKPSSGLEIYRPTVKFNSIYSPHPGAQPLLKYNHDVDIVKFKGRFFAAWNGNETQAEDVPGQYNFLSASDDFEHWSKPVKFLTRAGGCESPVESDNQWQPGFVNDHDKTLFCAWCDLGARRTFIASSRDGVHWQNRDVATAPQSLAGQVVGFPTNHGLLTSKGVIMFPCSLPLPEDKLYPGHTKYAAVLFSTDAGATWQWSEPVEAVNWSAMGENPADFGGENVYLWEPMLVEHGDGRIGLLIRNATAQDAPERLEKPHRMLLYAVSADHGLTWSKARPVEVDTVCARNFAVAGAGTRDSLLMVINDHHVGMPKRIPNDRFFLSLYCSPTSDPDLLLPGPIVQPEGGTGQYPNGFVDNGKLYLAYTYAGMHSSVVEPLPDFSKPFLLPRGGRPGLKIEGNLARFEQRQSSLGLVLTEALTLQPKLRLVFDVNVQRYNGLQWVLLTLGGKTRQGTTLRAIYSAEAKSDVFQVRTPGNKWVDLAPFQLEAWNHIEITLMPEGFAVAVNQAAPQTFKIPLLRKICFGGLYVAPEWPPLMTRSSDVRLKLDSIRVS